MYTRVSPYAFGMWIGYLHFHNKQYDFCQGILTPIFEWLCVFACLTISLYGCLPKNANYPGLALPPFP